jgi:hypothetical protein
MAAAEKICEYSGEYPGAKMYEYKRNHLQILPKYRKNFRYADATLYVYEDSVNDYSYTLRVHNMDLLGMVLGSYSGESPNIRQLIKRLKRMLRCRTLKVYRFPLPKYKLKPFHLTNNP